MQWDMTMILFLFKAYRALRDSIGISLPRYDKNTTEYYIIPVNNTQEAWEAQENKLGAFSKKDLKLKGKNWECRMI